MEAHTEKSRVAAQMSGKAEVQNPRLRTPHASQGSALLPLEDVKTDGVEVAMNQW